MDYNYESLLDQRFQMLCQSLLVREYPGLQCLPVDMPDGGRDAFVRNHSSRSQIIFQVKYSRNPAKVADAADWVINAIKGEEEKIKKLVDREASQYILVTNMPGTSHLDGGSIDRVQTYINSTLPVTGSCLWREDLDRRLDDHYDLKLRYPSLISGPDAMRLMFEKACAGEGAERRRRALNSYFGHQYNQDRLVRFKQAELSASPLFRLFVDVPAQPPQRRGPRARTASRQFISALRRSVIESSPGARPHAMRVPIAYRQRSSKSGDQLVIWDGIGYRPAQIGAAYLLFDLSFADAASQIVIEGAPGQGKSTLVQYVAQVHRYRLLNRPPLADRLSEECAKAPLNMPFKLELRDVAQWLEGFNPWAAEQKVSHSKPRTLESAIAAHIEKHSGGVPFDAGDFLMILDSVPALIILDALDEVADLDQRRRVVDEVEDCVARLRQQAHEVRFIVTSRPTAIADSPSFSDETFAYLTLAPLSEKLALDYADRWATARRLSSQDKAEIRRILSAKMSAPHISELAKNAMQLSILLNLIYVRGESLPDKRTELYDKYIDIFFTREAEKWASVKRHQRLLIDIHRYLGYYLHSHAERDQSTGRISYQELRQVVSDYLVSEGQPTDAIEELLTGVVQRVVAIVSRVEGTYEFEVQPLREYFAARHLYDTASYSPAGQQRSGTKPDRFDGIAKNPYWLNVTRFYCGCFSKGELLDLADRLGELIATPRLRSLTYPRMLGVALLQDWVFTQSPKATDRAINAIFDDFGLRWAGIESYVLGSTRSLADVSLSLSRDTGAESLLKAAWAQISDQPQGEGVRELCRYLSSLPLDSQVSQLWLQKVSASTSEERQKWFDIGAALTVFATLSKEEVASVLKGSGAAANPNHMDGLLVNVMNGGAGLGKLPEKYCQSAVRLVLDRRVSDDRFGFPGRPSILDQLRVLTSRDIWLHLLRAYDIDAFMNQFLGHDGSASATDVPPRIREQLQAVFGTIRRATDSPNGLEMWRILTGVLDSSFGKSFAAAELGVMSGRFAFTGGDPYVRADDLFDVRLSRPDRVRSARKRSGNGEWWLTQLRSAADDYDLVFWALSAYAWTTPECFVGLAPAFDEAVRKTDSSLRDSLMTACYFANAYSKNACRVVEKFTAASVRNFDSSTAAILMHRMYGAEREIVWREQLLRNLEAPGVADSVLRHVVSAIATGELSNDKGLDLARRCYSAAAVSRLEWVASSIKRYPAVFARSILQDPWSMPSELVVRAIRSVGNTLPRATPVATIAEAEKWFDTD